MDQKENLSALSDHDRVRNEHLAWAQALPERRERERQGLEEGHKRMQEHLEQKRAFQEALKERPIMPPDLAPKADKRVAEGEIYQAQKTRRQGLVASQ